MELSQAATYPSFVNGLIGGVMIGAAGALFLLGAGRIAGVSGITARALGLSQGSLPRFIALLFLVGLVIGAVGVNLLVVPVDARFPPSAWMLILGGLITGFGTRLGSGCTSGHGVCGMSRLSRRSLAATATFIAAGIATVAILNAVKLGW